MDVAMYLSGSGWSDSSINMSIDGFAGRSWSSLATDALNGQIIYGALAPVPEPGALLSMFVGLSGLVGMAVRRRK
jgi:hypothetical protein